MYALKGHQALVTGGNRGIGLGIATKLAALGSQVTILGRDIDLLKQRTLELNNTYPLGDSQQHRYIQLDLSSPAQIEPAVKQMKNVSILINCSGIAQNQLLLRTPIDDLQKITTVNLISPMVLCKSFAKTMAKIKSSCHIVNVSSAVAALDSPSLDLVGASAYCASKSGLSKFTKVLAKEMALQRSTRHINVQCVEPGYVQETQIGAKVDMSQFADQAIAFETVEQVSENVCRLILNSN